MTDSATRASHVRLPLRGNSLGPHILRDYPVGMGVEVDEYINHFNAGQDYAAADWIVTETGAGGTQIIDAQELGGALALLNDTNDNDSVELQAQNGAAVSEHWALTSGKRLWLRLRFKLSDVVDSDLIFGLAITDTTLIDAVTDGLYFTKADGSAVLTAVAEKDSTASTVTVATLVNDTYVDVGMYYDGKSTVYVMQKRADSETEPERWREIGSLTTNLPDDEQLAISFAWQNGAASAETAKIGHIHVAQER